jgi:zinc/manganese transport system substrate-binding protein
MIKLTLDHQLELEVKKVLSFNSSFYSARMEHINFNSHKQNPMIQKLLIQTTVALFAILSLIFPATTHAKLNVVATLPDYGEVAKEIGGDKVDVTILAKPTEDPHFVDAKPSFILKLNRADALIEGGAELEMGWLPPLLEGSRNTKIQTGAPGRIITSEGIQLLGIPDSVSRAQGDVHTQGNPHFMVDPVRAKMVASHIASAFSKLDPDSAAAYEANLRIFNETLDLKMQEWTRALASFHNQPVVAYHDSWIYFAERFGLKIDVFLEPKPGISPSPSHLAIVIEKMKQQHIKAILVEPHHDRKIAESVASHTGAQVVDVAQFPEGRPNTKTYFDLMDSIVSNLAKAMGTH